MVTLALRKSAQATSLRFRPTPPIVLEYFAWAAVHRGTRPSTLVGYGRELGLFVGELGHDPTRYSASAIRDFIVQRAADFPSGDAHQPLSAARGFLRFLAATGRVPPTLVGAVPTLAHWRGQRLVSTISDDDVERLIDSCDLRTDLGRRDHAILLLLAKLALRPGDVAQLRLVDLDWAEGLLRVSGKARRQERLPLPQEVGDALLRYLERGRPDCIEEHVFVRVQPPVAPLTRYGVSDVVRRAIRRCGIQAPHCGAYLLRHSAATSLLARGHSLQTIGALLRHRSIETTTLYAKVDRDLLQSVAQPWPEEVR